MSIMDQLASFLQAVGYYTATIRPLLPMYTHLLLSALFPIYTGAHASLSRPSSAAKPPKKKQRHVDDDEPEESKQKMEGLSPIDAIFLPLLGGLSLSGLYYLITWLEDPAILNKVLNWYFALFGVLALAGFLNDCIVTIHSFVFPTIYASNAQLWKVNIKSRKAKAISKNPTDGMLWEERDSPLPEPLSTFPFPALEKRIFWTLKELPSRKIRIRAYVHKLFHSDSRIGPHGLAAILFAVIVQLYFNLIDKPWWLTNLLGFSVAYSVLQIMTPTTSWTGTLILGGLFVYDIYFVFFTPLMVTVATNIDIPAKLLFPRPAGSDGKPGMSMLGLGDVVLPGMMISFALRFDLYLFYLRKQKHKSISDGADIKGSDDQHQTENTSKKAASKENKIVKAKWLKATGNWGDRYWTQGANIENLKSVQGGVFPKIYFHASLAGYFVGMITTLLVMQTYGHAQPALLYLVPGTLGALWGTAFVNGDLKTLWAFTEAGEEDEMEKGKKEVETKDAGEGDDNRSIWAVGYWTKLFREDILGFAPAKESKKSAHEGDTKGTRNDQQTKNKENINMQQVGDSDQDTKGSAPHRESELISFSVTLPHSSSSNWRNEKDLNKLAEIGHTKRKRSEAGDSDSASEASTENTSKHIRIDPEWRKENTDVHHELGETY
ncbi:minor histocompatibility antigen H13, partial [Lecanoromycetidae sp. Uapishka_2]